MASRFEVTQRMLKLWLRITAIAIKINHAKQIILIHFRSHHFTPLDNLCINNLLAELHIRIKTYFETIIEKYCVDHGLSYYFIQLQVTHIHCFRRNHFDAITK